MLAAISLAVCAICIQLQVDFTGAFSDEKSCSPNPCQHGGKCEMRKDRRDETTAYCKCPRGWTGNNCNYPCMNVYKSCEKLWRDEGRCNIHRAWTDWYDINCPETCDFCKVDNSTIPEGLPFAPKLEPIQFLVGKYELSQDQPGLEHYPVQFARGTYFTEELNFEIAQVPMFGTPCLNYTAIARNTKNPNDIHIERGFASVADLYGEYPIEIAIMRTTNNGAVFWEDGFAQKGRKKFDFQLAGIRTLKYDRDGVDLRGNFPDGANRTFTVNPSGLHVETSVLRHGKTQTFKHFYKRIVERRRRSVQVM